MLNAHFNPGTLHRHLGLLLLLGLCGASPVPRDVLAAGPIAPPGGGSSPQTVVGIGVALTGDTLTVSGSSVRLAGVAAPADGQTCFTRFSREYDCFKLSTEMLQSLMGEHEVTCDIEASDRTGQRVGRCRANGVDLGGAMVTRGWAFAYSRLSERYERAEVYAQIHRLGMWGGRVEKPWQWKTRKLREQAR